MKKKKILLTYLSFGSGHKAVCNYIKRYFEDNSKQYEIEAIDILEYSNDMFVNSQQKMYNFISLQFPILWNSVYYGFNNRLVTLANTLPRFFMYNKKLRNKVKDFNPDLVISTHYYSSYLIQRMILKKEIDTKLITIVTDYDRHRIWMAGSKVEDAVMVACEDTKKFFIKKKMNKDLVHEIGGVPVYPNHDENFNPDEVKKLFEHPEYPLCLFFGGGTNGNKRSIAYLEEALNSNLKINIIYVAGKNEKAKNHVDKLIEENGYTNAVALGFITNNGDYFEMSDFVVSKPGGLQTTEALLYNKPMMMILSSGGQENYNLRFLEREHYGKYFRNPNSFAKYLKEISDDNNIIKEYHENIKNKSSNTAMEQLFEYVNETI